MPNEPRYYCSLAPFRNLFRSGVPILTYHKFGPRPPGVRLKSLFVDVDLFARQLAELQEAGFTSIALEDVPGASTNKSRRVALTFDDGFRNVWEHALPVLERYRFSGTLFLVSDLLGKTNEWDWYHDEVREPMMDEVQVRDWLAAGQVIGSHGRTHPFLTRIPLQQARSEIADSKKALEDRFGVAIEHFCYPYGDWNEAVRDLVAAAGYRTACTTDTGVNRAGQSPLALKRIMARYPARTLKGWLRRWTGRDKRSG